MALYPIQTISQSDAGMQHIPSGSMVCVSLLIQSGNVAGLSLAHIAMTQDFSIRAWLSKEIDGEPIGPVWCLARVNELFLVYDQVMTPATEAPRKVAVVPGAFYLNVLNLCNSENLFSFQLNLLD